MDNRNNSGGNRDTDNQSPIRGVPVMDIQAPRTSFTPKRTEVSENPVSTELQKPQDIATDVPVNGQPSDTSDIEVSQQVENESPEEPVVAETLVQPVESDVAEASSEQTQDQNWSTDVTEAPAQSSEVAPADAQNDIPEESAVAQEVSVEAYTEDQSTSAESAPTVQSDEHAETQDYIEEAQPTAEEPVSAVEQEPANDNAGHVQPIQKKSPVLLVVIAVVVALLLAGAAVFAYLQTREEEPVETNNTQQEAAITQEPAGPVTTEEVDETASLVDETAASIDDTDLSEDSLSDATLGL